MNFVPLIGNTGDFVESTIEATSVTHMKELIEHLRTNALRTDGPFVLRSGVESDWYLDARQTTYSGEGASLVGEAILKVLDPAAVAVGGMTMGADPVAIAVAMTGSQRQRPLRAFSVRQQVKGHGIGGRLVGPVASGDAVAVVEDTVTTGNALLEAIDVLVEAGIEVIQAVCLVDRSDGMASRRIGERGIPFVALLRPADLGVE